MKVALTGATGYIGSHVLTELHEHGHEVTAGGWRHAGGSRPLRCLPFATLLFIAANVVVFAFVLPHGTADEARFDYEHAAVGCELVQARPLDVG
jgi:nucleoside-diphosphate-sugar epimerase